MSIIGLLCLLFALVAALLLVLYALQRRDMLNVVELSQQLQRIAIGGRLAGRVDVSSDKPEVAALVTAVNHLLTRAGPGAEREATDAPKLFADLGERIHEAVLVHREVIVYANRQFASFVGVDRVELIGRRLADLVPPEYAELVSENITRRLAGETAAERYEIDMVGLQGQVSRLEISSTVVEYERATRCSSPGSRSFRRRPCRRCACPPTAAPTSRSCSRCSRWRRPSSPPTRTGASAT